MNINLFFLFVIVVLSAILFLFKPLYVKEKKFDEIPTFELENFKLIELSNQGLSTMMNGGKGVRFVDRYLVKHINYTDNSRGYIANMLADNGLYKDDIIELEGNVVYSRENDFSFSSQKAVYDKKTNLVASPDYIAKLGENTAQGTHISYNNDTGEITSKNIYINYKLKER